MSDNRTRVALVDAFTDEPLTGNAAGVIPDAAGLSEEQMQAIARELSVSETAFLLPSGSADRRVRYFTPTQEVDLCGHATVGSHVFLLEDGQVTPGTHSLETNVGDLSIEITDDGRVWMTQDQPSVRRIDLAQERVAGALGIDPDAIRAVSDDLPIAVSSTGLPFVVVPATYLSDLSDADPDMAAIEDISEEFDAAGIYLFTFDALDSESTLHARMFAPAAGVPEDPVTGTASGAAGAYLRRFGAFDGDLPDEMVFEQGHFVDRPGTVRVSVGDTVRVGGDGVVSLEGDLSVPPEDDADDILEA